MNFLAMARKFIGTFRAMFCSNAKHKEQISVLEKRIGALEESLKASTNEKASLEKTNSFLKEGRNRRKKTKFSILMMSRVGEGKTLSQCSAARKAKAGIPSGSFQENRRVIGESKGKYRVPSSASVN